MHYLQRIYDRYSLPPPIAGHILRPPYHLLISNNTRAAISFSFIRPKKKYTPPLTYPATLLRY